MRHIAFLLTVVAALATPRAASAELPPLVPREVIFGNYQRASPTLSPDAKRLAFVAPDKNNVNQVWVQTLGKDDAKAVTADKKRGIRNYMWAWDDRTLLYHQDKDGDELFHVYAVDLDSGNVRDLTPWQGVRAFVYEVSPRFPSTIMVGANVRKRTTMDVYRVDLKTGATVFDIENPGDFNGFYFDDNFVGRAVTARLPDGSTELKVRDSASSPWKSIVKVSPEETFEMLDFTKDGQALYMLTSVGADTVRLVKRELVTGKQTELAHDPRVDLSDVVINPISHAVEAYRAEVGRGEWHAMDPALTAEFAVLGKLAEGEFKIASRDRADRHWLVKFRRDRGAEQWYLWDRTTQKGSFLYVAEPKLNDYKFAEMKPIEFTARDGMQLSGYLTVPVGIAAKNLPLVLYPHGGPWDRDSWGFHAEAQWLVNRGYAVLQVNFRGSAGYGKKYLNAGNKQWGQKMHLDMLDAVAWTVKAGIVDPKRVAVYGGSYGGYEALAAAAYSSDVFHCVVAVCAPANLFTLWASTPPYAHTLKVMFRQRVGDPDDAKDKAMLQAASPLFAAKNIKIPVLIGQGANDPRVTKAEAEQIFNAIATTGGRSTYVLYPDEGHGFARSENTIDFLARAEAFLAAELGGRLEPLKGDRYPGSSAVVRVVGK